MKEEGRFIVLILKVGLGHFFLKMEVLVYSTLLDEIGHQIGPCQKGMWSQKQIQIKSTKPSQCPKDQYHDFGMEDLFNKDNQIEESMSDTCSRDLRQPG